MSRIQELERDLWEQVKNILNRQARFYQRLEKIEDELFHSPDKCPFCSKVTKIRKTKCYVCGR